ncbi:FAD-binding oxidoreductase [Georgenia subflava]|uniref:FAD-binding protein n=1 Tax=Georgenia subflava TaxID=1622177 RepID=A0A6N7EGT0_9MICO|nr:FAD-binding oxidoreductase [Georgenia subflava]MPV35897.1 FAD-binding protein [Georgenia subflava]
MTTTLPTTTVRTELKDFSGELIGPDDPGYDDARRVYNASIDRRPALVARPRGPADVARAVAFARAHDLPVAVRGGGHNGAGLGTVDDGVVIDLRHLREVEVDAAARTATVGGGATWGEVDRATSAFGLATPSGIISTTGVGGLTLGGGIGHLTRRCGLAIDNLLSADLVLADGRQVTASSTENPDLFWAIRGGGGNFGIVTRFVFRLHELSTVVAGPVFWPVEQTAEVLAVYRDLLPAAPRELNGFFLVGAVPPAPPFPEELHLRTVCGVLFCWTGEDEAAAEAAVAPFLDATPPPLLKALAPMPHPVMQSMFDGLYPTGDQWYWRADFVTEIPDEALEIHARFGAALPTWKSTMHLYPVDGAAHDVGPSETAWNYREARWGAVFAGVDADPANLERIRQWSIDYFEALHPYSAGGAYVNMMMDEGEERVRASYRDNYGRLASVKTVYDPENTFRVNQNIRPAT